MNHDYYVQLCCDEFALGTFCVSWCGMPVLDNKKYKYKCIYIYILSIFDEINVNIMTLIGWGGWKNDEDRSHMRQFTSAGFTPLTVLGIQLNHQTCALSSWKAPVFVLPVIVADSDTLVGENFHLVGHTTIDLESNLVGGWPTPLKNMKVSWEYDSQYMEKSCKPPTRISHYSNHS